MTDERPKAYSYIRFSSPAQATGDSYRRQRAAAELYCATNNLKFVASRDYLFLDEGRSAFKGKHLDDTGELARFLSFVESGAIEPGSYLIVESLDRLSREKVKEALPRFLDLLGKGINIYTSIDAKLYTSDYNELDLIVSIVQMSRAHSESRIKGERVSKAWRQKQELARESLTPLGRACPYWLEYVDGKYVEIPDRIAAIRTIFELTNSGHGQRKIAAILNERKIPVFGSNKRNLNGAWGSSSVGKILSNRALIGEYQPTGLVNGARALLGDPIKGFFPVIVNENEFYSAKIARSGRRTAGATKQSKNFNVWQGVAKCADCDQAMHLVNKGTPPKGNKYIRCYGAAKGVCRAKMIRLDHSENIFIEVLAKVDSLSLVQTSKDELNKQIQILEHKSHDISSRLLELQRMVVSTGGVLPVTLLSSVMELESQQAENARQQEQLRSQLYNSTITDKKDFYNRLDIESYEGRFRANALLKNLKVKVKMRAEEFSENYTIVKEGQELLQITFSDGELYFYAKNSAGMQLIKQQGDDDFITQIGEYIMKHKKVD